MSAVISVLILLTCIILIIAVLIQNPKGGGLATGFTTGSQVMGVRRTADFLEKATWTLAVLLFVFSVATTSPAGRSKGAASPSETSTTKDKASEFDKKAPAPGTNNANPGGGSMQPPTAVPVPKKP
ncbi:MAG: preprotein translocase subunit SecG [Bacteroidetes bacterium]|jgi:preprotein translocase subunit SecG|nr:preprotein translocase subunit SecG [Bacteroidota bacterium]